MKLFKDLGISELVLKSVEDMGYEEPTKIQEEVVPVILDGNDVIAQAQTGTGKTAAFGMPLVDMIEGGKGLQGLVLSPTRELAIQVAGEVRKLGKHKNIKEVAIYGGQPIDRQIRSIKQGANIVVGTPGRVLDHINRRTLNLSNIKFVVLDEADEMLDMGFIEDIETILSNTGAERQTMLFSATMPREIKDIAKKYMKSPVHVSVMPKEVTVNTVEQLYINVNEKNKLDAFTRVLDSNEIQSGIVFCRTKKSVDELVESLQSLGYSVEGIHGDYNQNHRINAINKFKDNTIDFLVATDVAARGLDIENVTHVFNYHIPENPEAYVHRIGRTGRAGRKGTAITFVTPRETNLLRMIEKYTKSKIKNIGVPKIKDVYENKVNKLKHLVLGTIEEDRLSEYTLIVEQLLEESDLMDICSAALKLIFEKENKIGLGELKEMKNEPVVEEVARVFVNVGRANGVEKKDVVKGFTSIKGVEGRDILKIDVFEKFTFVNVNMEAAHRILSNKYGIKIKDKKVRVEEAKKR